MIDLPFRTQRLILRGWEERDRETFHRLNSEEAVMRFFPFRRSRAESDAMMDTLNARQERDGMTFFATETIADGKLIGLVGLTPVAGDMPMAPAVEIGWRLLPEAWGQRFATEAASACLDRAFAEEELRTVDSFCVDTNKPSEAVMIRLGMRLIGGFDHPSVNATTHPDLAPHRHYRITRQAWAARGARGTAR